MASEQELQAQLSQIEAARRANQEAITQIEGQLARGEYKDERKARDFIRALKNASSMSGEAEARIRVNLRAEQESTRTGELSYKIKRRLTKSTTERERRALETEAGFTQEEARGVRTHELLRAKSLSGEHQRSRRQRAYEEAQLQRKYPVTVGEMTTTDYETRQQTYTGYAYPGQDRILAVRSVQLEEQETRAASSKAWKEANISLLGGGIGTAYTTIPGSNMTGVSDADIKLHETRRQQFKRGFTESFGVMADIGFAEHWLAPKKAEAKLTTFKQEYESYSKYEKIGAATGRLVGGFPLTQIAFMSGEAGITVERGIKEVGVRTSKEETLLRSPFGQQLILKSRTAEQEAVGEELWGTRTLHTFFGTGKKARQEATLKGLEEEGIPSSQLSAFERQRKFQEGGTFGGLVTQEVGGELTGGGIFVSVGRRVTKRTTRGILSGAAGGYVEGGGTMTFSARQEDRAPTAKEFIIGAGAGSLTAGGFNYLIQKKAPLPGVTGKAKETALRQQRKIILVGRVIDPLEYPGDIIGGAIMRTGRGVSRAFRPRTVALTPGLSQQPTAFPSGKTPGQAFSATQQQMVVPAEDIGLAIQQTQTSASTITTTPTTTTSLVTPATTATTPSVATMSSFAVTPASSISAVTNPAPAVNIAPQFRFLPPFPYVPKSRPGYDWFDFPKRGGVKLGFAPGIAARGLNIHGPMPSPAQIGAGLTIRPIVDMSTGVGWTRTKKGRKKKKGRSKGKKLPFTL